MSHPLPPATTIQATDQAVTLTVYEALPRHPYPRVAAITLGPRAMKALARELYRAAEEGAGYKLMGGSTCAG